MYCDSEIYVFPTLHADWTSITADSYIYYKDDWLIITEVKDVNWVMKIVEEYSPKYIVAMIQPAQHLVEGGMYIGRFTIPLKDIPTYVEEIYILVTVSYIAKDVIREFRRLSSNRDLKIEAVRKGIRSLAEFKHR